jgi:hypothetical protein
MKLLIAAALAATSAIALAGPTGLNMVPTSDTLGHRQAAYTYFANGTEHSVTKRYTHVHGIQVGMGDRFEFGFDNDFAKAWDWNAKVKLWESADASQAASFGVMRATSPGTDSYLALRQDFDAGRLHFGVSSFNAGTLMAGWDMPLGPGVLMADTSTGAAGFWSVGYYQTVQADWGLGLSAAVIVPYDSSQPTNHFFGLTWQRAF